VLGIFFGSKFGLGSNAGSGTQLGLDANTIWIWIGIGIGSRLADLSQQHANNMCDRIGDSGGLNLRSGAAGEMISDVGLAFSGKSNTFT
jgi:hypothetical protein